MNALGWSLLVITCMHTSGLARELVLTNIVYRHGDRSPIAIYPKDEHQESVWPDGLGMLTERGKQQQTRLGAFLRDRYKKFISDRFVTSEVHIRSSDFDRTLESAYSNLAGLYAANHSDTWDGNFIKWQPTPVHSVPIILDEVLSMGRPCAKYQSLYNETVLPALERLDKDYSAMFELLSKLTGYDMSYQTAWRLRDTLFCENEHGLTLPEWTKWTNFSCAPSAAFPCQNRKVYDILYDFSLFEYSQVAKAKELHKYHGGPLLMEILDNFNRVVKDRMNTPQFYMYSAHDTTVASILSVMGAFNERLPEYTATVFVELYNTSTSSGENEYVVELSYKNVTDNNTVYQLSIPGCMAPCNLANFNEAFHNLTISNWDKACFNNQGITEGEIITISVCLTLVVVLSVTTVICYSRKRRMSRGYTKVRTDNIPLSRA